MAGALRAWGKGPLGLKSLLNHRPFLYERGAILDAIDHDIGAERDRRRAKTSCRHPYLRAELLVRDLSGRSGSYRGGDDCKLALNLLLGLQRVRDVA